MEGRFRGLVEAQTEMISLAGADGRLVYVNPSYARHFGLAPDAMVGRSLYEFIEAPDREAVRRQIDTTMRTQLPQSGENRMRNARGEQIWVAWTNAVLVDTTGESLLHSVGRDISARKALEEQLARGERFLLEIADNVPVRIAYLDADRRFRFVNRALCERYGRPREAIVGLTRAELVRGPTPPEVEAKVLATLRGEPVRFEYDDRLADGSVRRIETQFVPDRRADGSIAGFFAIGRDVTEQTSARLELQRQAATLRSVAESIPSMVAVVGADHRYRFVNRAFEQWIGARREAIVGSSLTEVLGATEYERSRPHVEAVLAGEARRFVKDYSGRRRGRHLAVNYIPLWLEDGTIDGFVGVADDISGHKETERHLLEKSQRDPLTGLLNRAGFEQVATRAIATEGTSSIALVYVDLDRFKPVNDTHGHGVGDQLLQQVARRIETQVRASDAVARLGGDEFAVLLSGLGSVDDARRVAQKVIDALHQPFVLDALGLRIGASAGLAFGLGDAQTWQALAARADAQLYRAKQAGRGCLVCEDI